MTIICYRDGTMAADSGTSSDGFWVGSAKKITRSPAGWLGGAAGEGSACEQFRDWMKTDGDCRAVHGLKAEEGDFHAILVNPHGEIFEVGHSGIIVPLRAHWACTGAPWKFAMGAMAAGLNAIDAVTLCLEHSTQVRGPIQVEHVGS